MNFRDRVLGGGGAVSFVIGFRGGVQILHDR